MSTSTIELSDGKKFKNRISLSLNQNRPTLDHIKAIFYPYFLNPNVEVGRKRENSRRQIKHRKPQPRTRHQVELGSSEKMTNTKPSSKSTRRQPPRSRRTTTPPDYFVSDESMLILSDISDTSDWEWIAGGFPCRDLARERFVSDSLKTSNQDENTRNFCETNSNIKVKILETSLTQKTSNKLNA